MTGRDDASDKSFCSDLNCGRMNTKYWPQVFSYLKNVISDIIADQVKLMNIQIECWNWLTSLQSVIN